MPRPNVWQTRCQAILSTEEQAARFGLPCGGTLQIVLEPVKPASRLRDLLSSIERHELVARFLDMETGVPHWHPRFQELVAALGITPRVCKPYTPQTKGKVERSIRVVKDDFWPGVRFTDLSDLNRQARACDLCLHIAKDPVLAELAEKALAEHVAGRALSDQPRGSGHDHRPRRRSPCRRRRSCR